MEVQREGVSIGTAEIRIDDKPYVTWPMYAMSSFVACFDDGLEVAPFTFRIEAKTVVHDKGWRRRFINRKEWVIFGNFGETRCGRAIGKTAIGYGGFISFHADDASLVQRLKIRWRLFVVNGIFAGAPRPYWADYCEKCFNPKGYV